MKKVYRGKTQGKKQTGQRKRSQSDVGRAKNDLKRFAISIAGLIPGIGTLLDIDNVYRDGKKLLSSGPRALMSVIGIRIKRTRRRTSRK
ncbi:MAG TPA: hypothetical protein VMW64_00240 [Dehalococcoidia bacterium]|nr:hypothetical protein [Dehalococcoidia bacterium]